MIVVRIKVKTALSCLIFFVQRTLRHELINALETQYLSIIVAKSKNFNDSFFVDGFLCFWKGSPLRLVQLTGSHFWMRFWAPGAHIQHAVHFFNNCVEIAHIKFHADRSLYHIPFKAL